MLWLQIEKSCCAFWRNKIPIPCMIQGPCVVPQQTWRLGNGAYPSKLWGMCARISSAAWLVGMMYGKISKRVQCLPQETSVVTAKPTNFLMSSAHRQCNLCTVETSLVNVVFPHHMPCKRCQGGTEILDPSSLYIPLNSRAVKNIMVGHTPLPSASREDRYI